MNALWYGIGCFLVLSLIILGSIGVVLWRHYRGCTYDLTIPCYSDWVCCTDPSCSSTQPTINTHLGVYFSNCLGSNSGKCNNGCNSLDYNTANSTYAHYQPYAETDKSVPTPYPVVANQNTVYTPETDYRHICANLPTTDTTI